MDRLHSVADARLSGLRLVKQIRPDLQTMYIKPPARRNIQQVVRYADISLNTSRQTILELNEEAGRQNTRHKIIIMIEMGELREGIIGDDLFQFYKMVLNLENIDIIGLGTNLGCLFGVEPTRDKLVQLSLYHQLIESSFKVSLPLLSGGTSITLPLITQRKIPPRINHFRVGEAAFLGISPLTGKKFRDLSDNAFEYNGQVLEMLEKDYQPDGQIGEGQVGHVPEIEEKGSSYRALVDFGLVDVQPEDLTLKDRNIRFFGTTSDMTVYDLGENRDRAGKSRYRVGSRIHFKPNYIAVARLMNSKYIDKVII
jgi:predicted amino acid racemase